jgi:hypothetical protein
MLPRRSKRVGQLKIAAVEQAEMSIPVLKATPGAIGVRLRGDI